LYWANEHLKEKLKEQQEGEPSNWHRPYYTDDRWPYRWFGFYWCNTTKGE
jgi:hypothetical protein